MENTMKGQLARGLLCVALLVTAIAPGLALAIDKEPNKFDEAMRLDFKFSGQITALDPTAGTVTVVNKEKGPITLSVPHDCMLFVKHKKGAATLADFKVGDEVKVLYQRDNTNVVCASLWQPGSNASKKQQKLQKTGPTE
jgi:Cu/Ag efflux protein CusF